MRPEWKNGVKLYMLWGMEVTDRMRLATTRQLPWGFTRQWNEHERLLVTRKADPLTKERQQKSTCLMTMRRQERQDTDGRKPAIQTLANHLKGRAHEDKLIQRLNNWEGLDGVLAVGYSPDRHPTLQSSVWMSWLQTRFSHIFFIGRRVFGDDLL